MKYALLGGLLSLVSVTYGMHQVKIKTSIPVISCFEQKIYHMGLLALSWEPSEGLFRELRKHRGLKHFFAYTKEAGRPDMEKWLVDQYMNRVERTFFGEVRELTDYQETWVKPVIEQHAGDYLRVRRAALFKNKQMPK